MELRMDEVTSKYKTWDTNLGLWHDCKESPEAKRKKANEEFKKEREEQLLKQRQQKANLLKTPVFCYQCKCARYPIDPCEHMIADGFEKGVDGSNFYSDTFESIERRKYLKQKMKTAKEPQKINLDSFK